ncbi:hypothetical protein UFOVP235_9 [uncultured Caudovirales phage]|uniref:Uncharacterized protein n=1 Tax=uncultured Caudovirales phage TaxID=2100421 RepID=A0A6J7WVR2_9CAUD|nr:hypothetical protein UFOVP235_9 [uncultured Caudovirales phage]
MVTKSVEISADEVRRLRRKVLMRAHAAIDALGDIAEGKIDPNRKDTMARVAASRVLLSKVLPEISASYAETHVHHHHDVSKLSKAQLRDLIESSVPSREGEQSAKVLENKGFPEPVTIDLPACLPDDAPDFVRDAPA